MSAHIEARTSRTMHSRVTVDQHHYDQQQPQQIGLHQRQQQQLQPKQQQQQLQAAAEASTEENNTTSILTDIVTKAGGKQGLANMSQAMLRQCFDPVMKSLEHVNAEELLDLERVTHGARLSNNVNVLPIHNLVKPQIKNNASCVRYLHISEIPDQYSCGIFIFPPFARMPLHDHPEMCVISRVLYGDLQCLSLDLDRHDQQQNYQQRQQHSTASKKRKRAPSVVDNNRRPDHLPKGAKRAFKNKIHHMHAPDVTMLFPYEGNLHEFVAGAQGAAVLDILVPPYDTECGRDCEFYDIIYEEPVGNDDDKEFPCDKKVCKDEGQKEEECNKEKGQPCWVHPIPHPDDFHCLAGKYGKLA